MHYVLTLDSWVLSRRAKGCADSQASLEWQALGLSDCSVTRAVFEDELLRTEQLVE